MIGKKKKEFFCKDKTLKGLFKKKLEDEAENFSLSESMFLWIMWPAAIFYIFSRSFARKY